MLKNSGGREAVTSFRRVPAVLSQYLSGINGLYSKFCAFLTTCSTFIGRDRGVSSILRGTIVDYRLV